MLSISIDTPSPPSISMHMLSPPSISMDTPSPPSISMAFGFKLLNDNRKLKATENGIPDSRWIRCPKIDAVVAANVSLSVKKAYRAATRLQQFWLDTVIPLVLILERADELELPGETISAIQISLQFMGNANHHTSVS